MIYYSVVANNNSAKKPTNGIYYWMDFMPGHLKTRHELLLLHRQPTRNAKPQGTKRTILDHKWRFGGSTETISQDLIDYYREEVRHRTLTDPEFRYLESRGYAVESNLYDMDDTVAPAPTETNGRNFFHHSAFDGSHHRTVHQ